MNYLRVNEVARMLGISEAWLRRADGRGHIPQARRDVNGWRIYSPEDVDSIRECLFPVEKKTSHGKTQK